MYGKFFASTFTGSMFGKGPLVFSVWGYVIANTVDSQVELNPNLLASIIGASAQDIQTAIDFLCSPDPESRSKIEGGRRLVKEGQFAYRVPTFAAYRGILNEEDRREYNRIKKAEQRSRDRKEKKSVKARVNDCQDVSAMSAQTEASSISTTKAVIQNPVAKATDTRFKPFVDLLQKYHQHTLKDVPFSFSAADGKQLKRFLAEHPHILEEHFRRCLWNKAKSDVAHGEPIKNWIGVILKYSEGPLDRFGKPIMENPRHEQNYQTNPADARTLRIANRTLEVAANLARVGAAPTIDAAGDERDGTVVLDAKPRLLPDSGRKGGD